MFVNELVSQIACLQPYGSQHVSCRPLTWFSIDSDYSNVPLELGTPASAPRVRVFKRPFPLRRTILKFSNPANVSKPWPVCSSTISISKHSDWSLPALPNDHVIVLCHGFMGFDSYGPFDYFRGVAENLQGNHVIAPKVSPTSGIEVRAKQLDKGIKDMLQDLPLPAGVTPKVHLIGLFYYNVCSQSGTEFWTLGHSMGGLDSRRLVCAQDEARRLGLPLVYEVLSVTTVSTPHRGSPAAECAKSVGKRQQ